MAARTGPVQVQIAASACLERRIDLPKAALSHAEKAVDLHLRGSLPMGGRGLVWCCRQIGEENGRLNWRALIVKETYLKDLTARAHQSGVNLREISLEGMTETPVWQADPISQTTVRNWGAATLLTVVLVALLVVVMTSWRNRDLHDLVDIRERRVAGLRDRIAQTNTRAQATADQDKAFAQQWQLYLSGSRHMAGLTDIATTLPPDVWLSEMSVSGGEWRLSGFSKQDISGMITALQALPRARNVRLEGPIQRDIYSNLNRFDLVLTMLPPEVR